MIIVARTLLLSLLVILSACSSSSRHVPLTTKQSTASNQQQNYLASSIGALIFLKQHCHHSQLGSEKEIVDRMVTLAASKGMSLTESDLHQLQQKSLQRYQTIVETGRDAENCQSLAASLTDIIHQAYQNNIH